MDIALLRIILELDKSQFDTGMDAAETRVKNFGNLKTPGAKITVDDKDAAAKLQNLQSLAQNLTSKTHTVNVKTNIQGGAQLDEFQKRIDNLSRRAYYQLSAGHQTTSTVTMPVVRGGAGVLNEAIKFESSFAGVRKTVEATEAELQTLARQLRDMAAGPNPIPIDVNELNKIAESAGQLGVVTPAIAGFTRTMADLGQTTNLTSDQAADSMARLANITQMSHSDFDRLGSTVVDLGNKFASTEAEIVKMGTRIAGAGHQIGLSEAEILGFATALSSVGVRAEMGGTAISRVFTETDKAVRASGESLDLFAKTAGMSADQFKKSFQTDAAGAIVAFISGLKRIETEGGNNVAVIEKLFGAQSRLRDTLQRASGAGELLTRALKVGANAWQENSALTEEANKRYATSASQLVILQNKARELAIELGTEMLPVLNDVVGVLGDKMPGAVHSSVNAWKAMPEPIRNTTLALSALVLMVGPINVLTGNIKLLCASLATLGKIAAGLISIPAAIGVAAGAAAYSAGNDPDQASIGEMAADPVKYFNQLRGRLAGAAYGTDYDNDVRGGWANDRAAAMNRARRLREQKQAADWAAKNQNLMTGPRSATPAQITAMQLAEQAKANTSHWSDSLVEDKEAKKRVSEAERLAKAHAAAMLKLDKDRLQDSVQAFDKAATSIEERARKHIGEIQNLTNELQGFFGGMQEKLIAKGITNDPLGPMIARFEKMLGLQGKVNAYARSAQSTLDATNTRRGVAQSRLDLLQGGDGAGVGYSRGAQSIPRVASDVSNAMLLQIAKSFTSGEPYYSCAFVASRLAKAVGLNVKPEAGALALERQVKARGWVPVDLNNLQRGDLIFNNRGGAGSGKGHVKMYAGDGQVVNSNHRQETLYNYRPKAGERAWRQVSGMGYAALPQSTLRDPEPDLPLAQWERKYPHLARQARSGDGSPSAGRSTAGRDAVAGMIPGLGDATAINPNGSITQMAREFAASFSKAAPVAKDWGTAVRDSETTTARFAAQSLLASRKFQNMLVAAGITGKKYQEFVREFRIASNEIDIRLNAPDARDAMRERLEAATKQANANLQAIKAEASYAQYETSMRTRGVSEANAARSLEYRKYADSLKGKDFTPEQIEGQLKAFRQKQLTDVASEEVQNYKAALKEVDEAAAEFKKQVALDREEMEKRSADAYFETATAEAKSRAEHNASVDEANAAMDSKRLDDIEQDMQAEMQRVRDVKQYITDIQNRVRLAAMPAGIDREMLNVQQQLKGQGWYQSDIDRALPVARQGMESEEQLEHIRNAADQMRSIIENSLTEGFDKGIGSGVRSFAKGIADMVKQRALSDLSANITNRIFGDSYAAAGGVGPVYQPNNYDVFGNRQNQNFTPGFAGPLPQQRYIPDVQNFPMDASRSRGGGILGLLGIGMGGGAGASLSVAELRVQNSTVDRATYHNAGFRNTTGLGGGASSEMSDDQVLMQLASAFGGVN